MLRIISQTLMNISLPSFPLLWGPPVWASLCSREDNSCKLETMKFRWLNYFLVLTSFNVILHICYLYILLGAHDSMDQTASSLYSFEQVVRRRRGRCEWWLLNPGSPPLQERDDLQGQRPGHQAGAPVEQHPGGPGGRCPPWGLQQALSLPGAQSGSLRQVEAVQDTQLRSCCWPVGWPLKTGNKHGGLELIPTPIDNLWIIDEKLIRGLWEKVVN